MSNLPDHHWPLFTFGTLRTGHCNHHYLAGRFDRMVPATLPGYGRVKDLMIARHPGLSVAGELFYLTPEMAESTLAGCDELEEIPPGQRVGHEYERKRVWVETADGPVEAWAYVQPEQS